VQSIDLRGDSLAAINLNPAELKSFIRTNCEALLAKLASAD
jgi:hypothetical protein